MSNTQVIVSVHTSSYYQNLWDSVRLVAFVAYMYVRRRRDRLAWRVAAGGARDVWQSGKSQLKRELFVSAGST
jgi:hypothetical protein